MANINININTNANNKCIECLVKKGIKRSKINLILCKLCVKLDKYKLITTTNAKKLYFLAEEDLDNLEEMEGHTGYCYGFYYYLEEIKNLACEIHNTDREYLDNVINNLLIAKQTRIREGKSKGIEKRDNAKIKRKTKLINALENAGLELRSDSKLCDKYIDGNIKDLLGVVKRMCQMKYLYEYCHMDECRDLAYQDQNDDWEAGYKPDCSVSEMAELIALDKYSNKKYPDKFPWQQ